MGDTIFYMRTSSPEGITPALNDEIIEDLRAFAEISEENFEKVLSALNHARPFLSHDEFRELIHSTFSEEEEIASIVARVVWSLHRMESDGPGADAVVRRLSAVEVADEPARQVVTTEQLDQLLLRVDQLKRAWSSLERHKKAEAIGKATGQRLQNFQLICDLRPVFNSGREEVEGWIPLTTMHIIMEGADGLPNAVDVVLSAKDVDNLVKLATAAQRKLQILRENVTRFDGCVPATELTCNNE